MTNPSKPLRVYVASSWRNVAIYPTVVEAIRALGFEVYDFKNPGEGKRGFSWGQISRAWNQKEEGWKNWTTSMYLDALATPIAQHGFDNDMEALKACDICVLVMPCGRSAHLEAGWATGAGKKTLVLWTDGQEAELMNKMHHGVYGSIETLCAELAEIRRKAELISNVRKVTEPEARYALRHFLPMFRHDPRFSIRNFVDSLMLSEPGAAALRASMSDEALLLQGEEAATYVENLLGDRHIQELVSSARRVAHVEARKVLRKGIETLQKIPSASIHSYLKEAVMSTETEEVLWAHLPSDAWMLKGDEGIAYLRAMLASNGEWISMVLQMVEEEVRLQDDKWGIEHDEKLDAPIWISILAGRLGRVFEAAQQNNADGYQKALVQIAAVAVSAIRALRASL